MFCGQLFPKTCAPVCLFVNWNLINFIHSKKQCWKQMLQIYCEWKKKYFYQNFDLSFIALIFFLDFVKKKKWKLVVIENEAVYATNICSRFFCIFCL